jgi:hypothetical protein
MMITAHHHGSACSCLAAKKVRADVGVAVELPPSTGELHVREEEEEKEFDRPRCPQPEMSSPNQTTNSVQDFIFEDSDEPLNPENDGVSFSGFRWSHVK